MRELQSLLEQHLAQNRTLVLATLVETQGSTYRKAGARLLITEDGQFRGLISGGCLEGNLLLHAKKVFSDGATRIVEYDMRAEEEGLWGLSLGCNGLVRIHLQLLKQLEDAIPFRIQSEADRQQQPRILISDINESIDSPAPALAIEMIKDSSDHSVFQSYGIDPEQLDIEMESMTASPANRIHRSDRGREYLVEQITPQFQLLIMGAGPDVGPLLHFSQACGWAVALTDYRTAYLSKARGLTADHLFKAEPDQLAEAISLSSVNAAVLMSHNLDADTGYLKSLAATSVPYIGILGPQSRAENLLEQLTAEERFDVQRRLHAPIGLDLGGEGPDAIALSIVAEIQAHRHNHSARPLKDKKMGIHE